MARNAEKAMTALARWRQMKLDEAHPERKAKRPHDPNDCMTVGASKRWRNDVIKEISKKIAQIQNPGLGEFKIRDLNDEINKLLRVKGHWEVRVKQLGGPDMMKHAPKWFNRDGQAVPGMAGYKYFGAAKDLPGVREIIEPPVIQSNKKTRAEIMRNIDAEYYGYMDDDDGLLIPLEREAEIIARERAIAEWTAKKESGELSTSRIEEEDIYKQPGTSKEEELDLTLAPRPVEVETDEIGQPQYIAHVPVPSQEDMEEALVHKKKMQLLGKYCSESLMQQSEDAKTIMGLTD